MLVERCDLSIRND